MQGCTTDLNYTRGIHNIKIGAQYQQTFLREHDSLGVVEATYNSPCVDGEREPSAGLFRSHGLRWRRGFSESQLSPRPGAL